MDEQTILAELVPAVNSLKTLALVALDMEDAHPMALPEPPEPDKVAAYERQMTTISASESTPSRSVKLLAAGLSERLSGPCGELFARGGDEVFRRS